MIAVPPIVDAHMGVRMASLTWNERNAFAAGCDHDGGLTELGGTLVDRMAELRIAIDLAHASPRTFWDVLERAPDATVLVSHASCRALYDHRRNLADDQLAALAQHRGVLGMMPHPFVLDPAGRHLDGVVDHIDHAVGIMGIEHVGLGGDFTRQIAHAIGEAGVIDDSGLSLDAALDELQGPQDYPALAAALRRRGYGDDDLAALLGGNLTALLRRGLPG